MRQRRFAMASLPPYVPASIEQPADRGGGDHSAASPGPLNRAESPLTAAGSSRLRQRRNAVYCRPPELDRLLGLPAGAWVADLLTDDRTESAEEAGR
ncbi:hypothetical protein BOX15_Mlig017159g1 [Macrostomum lignano]|uniref:Uncharacterized protein n=1 Tax=Macrostomum lignano TaxID=282301 RepID=A0A267E9X4_9PLAT|nr:hypothetical protein BOX15_Mlig017159g2 [Macrostomum lignano]PAA90591.1 hypothetical protein BOX15_Mlig017159g1 [Macrostomum lignano]